MRIIALLLVAFVALSHGTFLILEMFYWNDPVGRDIFGTTPEFAAASAALAKYDLLLMPTLPLRATKLPDPAGPRMDIISRGFEMLPNTAPFDVTGHPAITLPCGMSEGLPAGLMLIGKHWNESTIYKAADAYEKSHDWKKVAA